MLVIDSIVGEAGGEGTSGAVMLSDVNDQGTGGVFNDLGRATMRIIPKDRFEAPTAVNSVTLTRYRVEYRRTDGRNTPGVDVPRPIDSTITATIQPGAARDIVFELVRHNQKREAPLANLALGLAKLSVLADVTFYGRDQSGKSASAHGSVGITFGDFFGS
jgi:hypothetical protein